MQIRCRLFIYSNRIFHLFIRFRASIVIFINPQRRCVVCSSNCKKKDMRYMCVGRVTAVCIGERFKIYHTKLHFSSK